VSKQQGITGAIGLTHWSSESEDQPTVSNI